MVTRNTASAEAKTAHDFVLKDQDGKDFRLSDQKGKRVLLSFHPLAWTSVCAKQMQSLEANVEEFESLNTIPVGISVDPVPAKKAWAEAIGVKRVRLLSDFWPHGSVAILYGLFRDKNGFSQRANVIVDENGKVIFSKVYDLRELPDIQEVIATLKSL
ncbi:MAG: redoxin domain-containing protein [Dehalococcoidia bacterium]|nr:redoxin domain-containing protein [Dehalococcoidia bacterium]